VACESSSAPIQPPGTVPMPFECPGRATPWKTARPRAIPKEEADQACAERPNASRCTRPPATIAATNTSGSGVTLDSAVNAGPGQ